MTKSNLTNPSVQTLAAADVSSRLGRNLAYLTALSDVVSSMRDDEVAEKTINDIAMLCLDLSRESSELADDLWRRYHEAMHRLGECPAPVDLVTVEG